MDCSTIEQKENRTLKSVKIAFIGAGSVNFGSGGFASWDHAARLEKMDNILIVAIVDPLVEKAQTVLKQKLDGPQATIYKDCEVFTDPKDLLTSSIQVDAVFIGVPPICRGSFEGGRDIELMFVKAGVHCFIEKPMSTLEMKDFEQYANEVIREQEKSNLVVSVGYMFRYHSAVTKMKELIANHGRKVMAINASYYYTYNYSRNRYWWDMNMSGGPIIEQATHLCDLARFLAGEIDLKSIQTTCLPPTDDQNDAGYLSSINPKLEEGLTLDRRPPRVTSAQWRFTNGGVGSLMHVIALYGTRYETRIDVIMDGLRMTLYEPYHPECKLTIRDSSSDIERTIYYASEDPYNNELSTFIEAVQTGDKSTIKSNYQDAVKTYELTWQIRDQKLQK